MRYIPEEYKKRFVRIHVPRTNKQPATGTGFQISENLILTARHVFFSEGRCTENPISLEWTEIRDQESGESVVVKVGPEFVLVFDNHDHDVALLKFEGGPPGEFSGSLIRPAHVWGERWCSCGYPRYAKKLPKHERPFKGFNGEIRDGSIDNSVLELDFRQDLEDHEVWKGISGAPVFSNQSIVGVITNIDKAPRQAVACSVAYLLRKTGFGSHFAAPRWSPESSRLASLLGQTNPELRKTLVKNLAMNPQDEQDSGTLAGALLSKPIGGMAEVLVNRINEFPGMSGQIRELLLEAVSEWMQLNAAEIVTEIAKKNGATAENPIIPVPFVTELLIESLMAAHDGRAARIDVQNEQVIPGDLCLSPSPELGACDPGKVSEVVAEDIGSRYGGIADVETYFEGINERHGTRLAIRRQVKNYRDHLYGQFEHACDE